MKDFQIGDLVSNHIGRGREDAHGELGIYLGPTSFGQRCAIAMAGLAVFVGAPADELHAMWLLEPKGAGGIRVWYIENHMQTSYFRIAQPISSCWVGDDTSAGLGPKDLR